MRPKVGRFLDGLFRLYERKDLQPGALTWLTYKLRGFLNPAWKQKFSYKRYALVNGIGNSEQSIKESKSPSIEILIVTKLDDFVLLSKVVKHAKKNSYNHISKVVLIVPDKKLKETRESFPDCDVIGEDEIVEPQIRRVISQRRPDRFGWILQQVLVTKYILNSQSAGVLVVDADTILLNKFLWLDSNFNQVLMPTYELHAPYYEFLKALSNRYRDPVNSFVSHHMLIQPAILKQIFDIINLPIALILERAFDFSDPKENSPFDLKYEIYAQYLFFNSPTTIRMEKWANLSLKRSELNKIEDSNFLEKTRRRYNSISFHHWNK